MSNSTLLNLSIKPEALKAVRTINLLLPKSEKQDISSFAWYNGRECGVSLVIGSTPCLKQRVIVINEHRCSDQLVLDVYERDWTTGQPCQNDAGYEKAYSDRVCFDYQNYTGIAQKVVALIIETNREQKVAMAKLMASKANIKAKST